jgi:hypothetical protein
VQRVFLRTFFRLQFVAFETLGYTRIMIGAAAFYRSWFLPLYRQQPACFHGNGGRKIAVVTSNRGVGTASFVAAAVAVGVGAPANTLLRASNLVSRLPLLREDTY